MSVPMSLVILLVLLTIPTCVLGAVQYLRSRLTPPWPGLIIPALSGIGSVALSLLFLFNMVALSPMGVLMSFLLLVVLNLPTTVYIVIYCLTRRRLQSQDEVTRMNLQDL